MSLYALAQRTTSGVAATPAWEVRSTAGNKPKLMELGFAQVTAIAGTYGLGRPAAIGVTPTSPQTFVDEGDGNAPTALTTGAVAWGTPPTVPTNFNRRITCEAAIGRGALWTFPRGLGLAVSSSLVLWIIATAPVVDVYAVVDE